MIIIPCPTMMAVMLEMQTAARIWVEVNMKIALTLTIMTWMHCWATTALTRIMMTRTEAVQAMMQPEMGPAASVSDQEPEAVAKRRLCLQTPTTMKRLLSICKAMINITGVIGRLTGNQAVRDGPHSVVNRDASLNNN
jgi:hypothetical protein